MPGENLTREEARERAALLTVDGYEVHLDVRSAVGPDTGDGPAPSAPSPPSASAAPSPARRASPTWSPPR
ncbi:hypothetical protein GCM10020221_35750 [Streptomyces thioluteus]|uniref:Uncharacterized protein n=1 Tax=Streptomyces thioluteus TaxID=66431 RepID=A0ABN3X4R0_STRTU